MIKESVFRATFIFSFLMDFSIPVIVRELVSSSSSEKSKVTSKFLLFVGKQTTNVDSII